MSFIHYTLIGHFEPRTVGPGYRACSRPIDPDRVERLLAEYPAEVADQVSLRDGSARCQWFPAGAVSGQVFEFAYRLAREEGCLAVENGRQVTWPPEAARAQAEEWERLLGRSGLADAAENRARVLAEEFEKRRGIERGEADRRPD
jgi:hypothetical protein